MMIEFFNKQITEIEKDRKNYIVVGYPRTRIQAIALQRVGLIPDNIFILKTTEASITDKIYEDFIKNRPGTESGIDKIVKDAVLEYAVYQFRKLS